MSLVMKNGLVACSPFDQESVKKAPGALALIDKRNALVELKVLIGTEGIKDEVYLSEFDTVFVRSDRANHDWAKTKFTCDKITRLNLETKVKEKAPFIIVPISEIVAISRNCLEEVPEEKKVN